MKIRIRNFHAVILSFCFLFIVYSIYFITNAANIVFVLNFILALGIILLSKFSLMSLIAALSFYPLISVFIQYNFGVSGGVLQLIFSNSTRVFYYAEMQLFTSLFLALLFLFLLSSNFLHNEKKFLQKDFSVSKASAEVCGLVGIAAILIMYPRLPFIFVLSERANTLFGGNAWNHLAIMSVMIAATTHFKNSFIVQFSTVFVVFWALSHYERVDIIGLIVALLIVLCVKKNVRLRLKTVILLGIVLACLLYLMVYIGETRSGFDVDFSYLTRKIVIQNTATDLAYSYNAGIDYYYNQGILWGKSILSYLVGAVPTLANPWRTDRLLASYYDTVGGSYLLNEPLINFGIPGIIAFSIIILAVLNRFVKRYTMYRYFAYIFLICASFRIVWYGIAYVETAYLFFLPILYLLCNQIDYRHSQKKSGTIQLQKNASY